MIELSEAITYSKQLNSTIYGKRIKAVIANQSPHKFAWYHGDPNDYSEILVGKTIGEAKAYGMFVEISVNDAVMLFGDGVSLRNQKDSNKISLKHQLLIEFEDASSVTASVQMYGGIWCFKKGQFNNKYYEIAKEKPLPTSEEFSKEYFYKLLNEENNKKISVKAFLGTEQRIPGVGNGSLQDILWKAKIHPKRKMSTLDSDETENLFFSLKFILEKMIEGGGRDTEKDLFGNSGQYKTVMSKNNIKNKCPNCGGEILKQNYMGGSIYFCCNCQKE
jgi:formamidopyrimidine-DNA glycosylase